MSESTENTGITGNTVCSNPFYLPLNAYLAQKPMTPLASAFLSPENVQYVLKQIASQLSCLTKQEPVAFLPNVDLATDMVQVLLNNQGLAGNPEALHNLNATFINTQAKQQFVSNNIRNRFHKWFIQQDRPRFIDYPGRADADMKHDVCLNTIDRTLKDPRRMYYQQFLASNKRRS